MKVSRLSNILVLAILLLPAFSTPKNIILMIGDGMGTEVVTAAGAYKYGKDYKSFGGKSILSMQTLTGHKYVTTYSSEGKGYDFGWNGGDVKYVMKDFVDSAAAASAMATGVKTYNQGIAVDPRKRNVTTIIELAQKSGMKTGVVTTVQFCHATPAGFSAHNENRNNYSQLAHDMIYNISPDVIIGAGNPDVVGTTPKYDYITKLDWEELKNGKTSYQMISSREDFVKYSKEKSDKKIFGMYLNQQQLPYCNADMSGVDKKVPTLVEITECAIKQLNNDNGFFLMIEGGSIDKANHGNNLDASIGETLAFDESVSKVINWIINNGGWENNLLIITADHDTGYMRNVKVEDIGLLPKVEWGVDGKGWGNHTNLMVDIYYQGYGDKTFNNYAISTKDFLHGDVSVIDNTDIFYVMNALLPK
jgi:alkaline phosphatase